MGIPCDHQAWEHRLRELAGATKLPASFFSEASAALAAGAGADALGQAYENGLAQHRRQRRASGSFYSPPHWVDFVVEHTVGSCLAGRNVEDTLALRVVDPACGGGVFLLAVGRRIAAHLLELGVELDARMRQRLARCLVGIDVDAEALAVCRLALAHEFGAGEFDLRRQNALDAPGAGFDAVVGNPPWGQKGFRFSPAEAARIRARFRCTRGPLDPFKLFVERAIDWTPIGGRWGLILPDIVLLKDQQQVRDLILETTAIEHIAHAGRAFPGVNLDVCVIIGRRVASVPKSHRIDITIGGRSRSLPQSLFLEQPQHRFNLFLTPARTALLRRLQNFSRLGDRFEMHEGVHTGNARAKLFVDGGPGDLAPLIVGGKEVDRFRLTWAGKFLRRDARALDRNAGDYANLGRPEWHEREKIVVRRTGDRVIAAFDPHGRYVSNNLFVLVPKAPMTASHQRALVAILNSQLMTWYFRTVQPRTGRLFAELKLCHLFDFPIPSSDHLTPAATRRLAALTRAMESGADHHDAIDREVADLFQLTAAERGLVMRR